MKRFGKFLATLFVAVLLFSMTAFANETCALAETSEGACEIWWMYDNIEHWRACVNHRDRAGNDTRVTEPEAHTFVDGVCTVCERECEAEIPVIVPEPEKPEGDDTDKDANKDKDEETGDKDSKYEKIGDYKVRDYKERPHEYKK